MKVTVEVEAALYRAIEFQAMKSAARLNEAVAKAMKAWLEAIEDAEDIADSNAAMAEYERDGGGLSAEDVFASLDATKRAVSPS
ncbi:MAG: hypothetical protein H0U52_18760 [Chloroflexi bacterium]|nr:hypothetical protein [Chloroflexota bacterium]